jgi:hypothetical protein
MEPMETAVRVAVGVALDEVARREGAKQQEAGPEVAKPEPPAAPAKEPATEEKAPPRTWWGRVKAFGKYLADNGLRATIAEAIRRGV